MSKLTIASLVSWFFSGLLLGFYGLDTLIRSQENLVSKHLTVIDVIGKSHFNWVNGMTEGAVHNFVQYVIAMPLYLLLFCVGILLFILGRLTSKV